MTQYTPTTAAILGGQPFDPSLVKALFTDLETAKNGKVDGDSGTANIQDDNILTFRATQPEGLSKTFRARQLIQGEPAAWPIVMRGSGTTDTFQLGALENLYDVEETAVRVVPPWDAYVRVHAFCSIEQIKVDLAVGEYVDVDVTARLLRNGGTVESWRLKFRQLYDAVARVGRRGLTFDLEYTDIAATKGTVYDYKMQLDFTNTAHSDGTIDIEVAHAISWSRFATARAYMR